MLKKSRKEYKDGKGLETVSRLGYKQTEAHKRKLSLSKIGDNNPMKNLEVRKKQSATRRRLGLRPPSNLGKKFSIKHRENLSKAHLKEKSYLWRGGMSYLPYSLDWTKTLRRAIRERDNYACKICGAVQNDRAFDVHHIDYNKNNCNPKNLITLCIPCHRKTGLNRDSWISYFERILWKQ